MENGYSQEMSRESVERLYQVNEMRDRFKEKAEELRRLGIHEVMLFGSAMKGTAHEDSDTDILVIHDPTPVKISESIKYSKDLERGIVDILGETDVNQIQFLPPEPEERQDITHISLQPKDTGELNEDGKPWYAEDAISIWKATDEESQ